MVGPLEQFFPELTTVGLPGQTYNPFPLYADASRRRVTLSVDEIQDGGPDTEVRMDQATVSPGAPCRPQTYSYTLYDTNHALLITADAVGCGSPEFSWSINGQALDVHGATPVMCMVIPIDPGASPDMHERELSISIELVPTGIATGFPS